MVVNHNNLVALPVILIKRINPSFFLFCFFCLFSQDGVMSKKMLARASLVEQFLHVGRTTPTEGEDQLKKNSFRQEHFRSSQYTGYSSLLRRYHLT